jgi:hypothetical protein
MTVKPEWPLSVALLKDEKRFRRAPRRTLIMRIAFDFGK